MDYTLTRIDPNGENDRYPLQKQEIVADPLEQQVHRTVYMGDSALGLFNGDIGITLPDEHGDLRVHFQLPDGSIKSVQPSRLPAHETAYAMTVHKSQGSEFDHTVLVLPNHFLPVLTRELVYTAITRARKQLSLYATEAVLLRAIRMPTQRRSGLAERLQATE